MGLLAFSGWEKVKVASVTGIQDGIAPVIVSASRSTDIPAFYADWLMQRLEAGYVKWVNPFNRKPQYVSLAKMRVIVFWTKHAAPLMPYLARFDQKRIGYYFTYTVNDYEDEGFEPGVPPLAERIDTFRRLADAIGPERVLWRFDPLILTDKLTVESLCEKIYRVGTQLAPYTKKLIISFIDIARYAKVKKNLAGRGGRWREFCRDDAEKLAQMLAELNRAWGLEVAACAEDWDLRSLGIQKNRCVDDALMARLFPDDEELMRFLGRGGPSGLFSDHLAAAGAFLRDRGQRAACGCVVSKDIGQYNTCPHLCWYCYANSSRTAVEKNCRTRAGSGETICGADPDPSGPHGKTGRIFFKPFGGTQNPLHT